MLAECKNGSLHLSSVTSTLFTGHWPLSWLSFSLDFYPSRKERLNFMSQQNFHVLLDGTSSGCITWETGRGRVVDRYHAAPRKETPRPQTQPSFTLAESQARDPSPTLCGRALQSRLSDSSSVGKGRLAPLKYVGSESVPPDLTLSSKSPCAGPPTRECQPLREHSRIPGQPLHVWTALMGTRYPHDSLPVLQFILTQHMKPVHRAGP